MDPGARFFHVAPKGKYAYSLVLGSHVKRKPKRMVLALENDVWMYESNVVYNNQDDANASGPFLQMVFLRPAMILIHDYIFYLVY